MKCSCRKGDLCAVCLGLRPADPRSPSTAKPAEPMLRVEATGWLLARLQADSRATLSVRVESGMYAANYETDITHVESDTYPNLTDAFCALIGLLP